MNKNKLATSKDRGGVRWLYDNWGHKKVRIRIEDPGEYSETSFNAEVDLVVAWSGDDKYDPVEFEDYLSCYIKWDSCSHFYFGEKDEEGNRDSYLHVCGAQYYRDHIEIMQYLYKLAFEQMGREPYDNSERYENTHPLQTNPLPTNSTKEGGE